MRELTRIATTTIKKIVKNGQNCYSSQILTAAVAMAKTTVIAHFRYKYVLDAAVAALLAAF